VIMEEPGQANTPRPGALNPNPIDLTVRHKPHDKSLETRLVGGERLDPQHVTIGIHYSAYMLIGVSIHTTNNHPYH
jgi:hypothetical protein